ncbi:MAG: DUF494 domain-containing protein [Pseudomonadota bacterium]
MKQTVIDILIYLFENFVDDEIALDTDQEQLRSELQNAGFEAAQITKAFNWLQDLTVIHDNEDALVESTSNTFRVFTDEEQAKLDTECRGFLQFLGDAGILNAVNRELVIDRVLALESDEIDIGQLKWIVLMVLFNRPGYEQAFMWMEDLLIDDAQTALH